MAGWFSPVFDDFFMEFINIGPVYIKGWTGGCGGSVGGGKQKSKMTQIVEFRVAMTCTCTHKGQYSTTRPKQA